MRPAAFSDTNRIDMSPESMARTNEGLSACGLRFGMIAAQVGIAFDTAPTMDFQSAPGLSA